MSRGDFFTLERKKVTVYSDFLTNFDRNPTTDNLALNINENAVKRAVRNIVLTNVGERFYNSSKGTRIRNGLFELFDPVTKNLLEIQIKETITALEPRASPLHVLVEEEQDSYGLRVRITFGIVNLISEPTTIDIFVERVR